MKTSTASLCGLAVATVLALSGCFGGSASPTPSVVVPPPVVTAPGVALQAVIRDAATGAPVTPVAPAVVTVSVYGADASKVVDFNSVSLYNATNGFAGPLTTSNGLLTIYVKPGTPVPSQMTLRVVASANGFVTSSDDVVIKSTDLKTDGSTTGIGVDISLVKVSAPPPSVTVVTAPVVVTAGVTPSTVTTNTTPASTAVVNGATVNLGSATVAVPATTTVYADAAKTVTLPAGTTTVSVTYNNAVTSNSLAVFPGGFTMSQDATGTALATPAVFVTAGFASIEVASTAANGTVTQAKTFDKPLSVTIPVPNGTINPATGLALKAGDLISVWSYDSVTGAWSVLKLTNGTIVKGTLGALDTSNNTFPATFATDHLTYFSLGETLTTTQSCPSAALTISGANGNKLDFTITKDSGGWSKEITLPATATATSQVVSIGSAPAGAVTVAVYQSGNLINTLQVATLCDSNGGSLPVPLAVTPTSTPASSLAVTVRNVCSGDSTAFSVVNGVDVTARTGTDITTVTTATGGIATFGKLTEGTTYTISSIGYADVSYLMKPAAAGNSLGLDKTVTCQVISGS